MNPTAALAAARLLSSAWRLGESIDALPESCRPQSRADGYAIQDQWFEEVSDEIAGWKIAATSEAGRKHIQVSGPIAGPIFAHRVHRGDAEISLAKVGMRVAECEVVFSLFEPLGPRVRPYTRDDVVRVIATMQPGIEVPDSRFAHFEKAGEAQLIADCACMNEMVLGAALPADARLDTLTRLEVTATLQTGARHTGLGSNALGDPVEALVWLVNELAQYGRTLEAGQFVTTGTCLTPVRVAPGDRIAVDYGWLGRLEASFV